MTVTVNFTANQNPFTDSHITQGNPASSSVNASSILDQIANSTSNLLTYNGAIDKAQSVAVTTTPLVNEADYYNAGMELCILHTDANNRIYTSVYNNGTDNKIVDVHRVVAGVDTTIISSPAQADASFVAGDVWKLEATWAGANATITLRKNGTTIGTPYVWNSAALTSGVPGYNLSKNGSPRCVRLSQIVFTGDVPTNPTASGATNEPAADTAAGVGATVNLGVRTPVIYEPNQAGVVVADATGVRAIVRNAIGGTELLDISTATIVSGVCTIDNDAVGALGSSVDLELRWTVGAETRSANGVLTVINLFL